MRALFFLILVLYITNANGQSNHTKQFVLGVVDEIDSRLLNEKRILNIYLPEGYKKDDTMTYPVIYLLDGGADEDFIHVAGLVQFNSFEWINRVPKSIVVGIANTDRKRDMAFPTSIQKDKEQYPTTGGSANFIAFIETELQPYINENYKTNSSKTLIGESLGGLLATEILFMKPSLFDRYIITSPSIWWNNASILNTKMANITKPTGIYIGVGKEGKTPGAIPHIQENDVKLLYQKIKSSKNNNIHVYFDYLPQETHATVGHQAVFNAFKLLYPANKK